MDSFFVGCNVVIGHLRYRNLWIGFLWLALVQLANGISAQEKRIDSSLDLVPADAAFYFSTMNHDALWSAVADSRALQHLRESPAGLKMRRAYRKGLSRGWDQFGDNPMRYYLEGYANSIDSVPGKLVMPYLERLFAKETFVFADQRFVGLLQAIKSFSGEIQPRLQAMTREQGAELSPALLAELLQKHLGEVEIPTIVVGAIVDEPEVFIGMLELMQTGLDSLRKEQIPDAEFFLNRLSYLKNENQQYLAFEVAGRDLPWQAIVESDPEFGEFAGLFQELLKDKSLAVSIGIRDDAVMFTVSSSLDEIKRLGSGPLLCDSEWFRPVAQSQKRGEKVVSVSYSSQEYMATTASSWGAIALAAAGITSQAIQQVESESLSPEIRERLTQRIQTDAADFAREMAQFDVQAGTRFSYCIQSPEGLEGFAYNFGQTPQLDGSTPLSLLKHVGSQPLFFVINRGVNNSEMTSVLEKYGVRLNDFLREFVPLAQESSEDAQTASRIVKRVLPLLSELGAASVKLSQDTSGKESGLVLDFSVAKRSWATAMPPSSRPLPMLAFAVVSEYRDPETLKSIGNSYLKIARELLAVLAEQNGDIPKGLQIPVPERKTQDGAEYFYYVLPSELGLAPSITLHAALNDRLLILGYLEEPTNSMFTERANSVFGPAGAASPATGAAYFDNRQLLNGIQGWIEYGFEQARLNQHPVELSVGDVVDLQMTEEEISESVSRLIQFLKCFQGFSTRSYLQDGAHVQHFLFKFQDLDK